MKPGSFISIVKKGCLKRFAEAHLARDFDLVCGNAALEEVGEFLNDVGDSKCDPNVTTIC